MCRIENIEKPLGKLRCFFRFFSIISKSTITAGVSRSFTYSIWIFLLTFIQNIFKTFTHYLYNPNLRFCIYKINRNLSKFVQSSNNSSSVCCFKNRKRALPQINIWYSYPLILCILCSLFMFLKLCTHLLLFSPISLGKIGTPLPVKSPFIMEIILFVRQFVNV